MEESDNPGEGIGNHYSSDLCKNEKTLEVHPFAITELYKLDLAFSAMHIRTLLYK